MGPPDSAPLYLLLRQHLKERCWPPGGWCLPNVLPGVPRKVPDTNRPGEGIFRTRPYSTSRAPPPPLAIVCLRGAEWWVISAMAIATVSRSCLMNWRNRRCRLLLAAPLSRSAMGLTAMGFPPGFGFERTPQKKGHA